MPARDASRHAAASPPRQKGAGVTASADALLAEVSQARELGCDVFQSTRIQHRLHAGIDLAAWLGDERSQRAFVSLSAAAKACDGRQDD